MLYYLSDGRKGNDHSLSGLMPDTRNRFTLLSELKQYSNRALREFDCLCGYLMDGFENQLPQLL